MADFAGYMDNLHLPHPKLIDIAVPANLCCGRQAEGQAEAALDAAEPTWAPLALTFAGVWEIEPEALAELRRADAARVQVLDVREPTEWHGSLGQIEGALLLPLAELPTCLGDIDPGHPAVAVCRSGRRSAQAGALLARAGFDQVVNLAGGMLRWRDQGLPLVGRASH